MSVIITFCHSEHLAWISEATFFSRGSKSAIQVEEVHNSSHFAIIVTVTAEQSGIEISEGG